MVRRRLPVGVLVAVLALTPAVGRAQFMIRSDAPPLPIDRAAADRAIAGVLGKLEEGYVFPDVAARMADAVRRHQAEKAYDRVSSGQELAALLTKHLQEVSKDKHVRVLCSSDKLPPPRAGRPGAGGRAAHLALMRKRNAAFVKVERLPGNVGYLRLDAFAPPEAAGRAAAAAMNFLADTDALLIDVRHNGGGEPHGVALVCSDLFDEKPVHLNSLYWRQGNRTDEFWTLKEVPGQRYVGKPVYVLASRRTFSGAEEFCYNLQTRHRAVIVGERTGGGAHPGGVVRVDDHFAVFVPTGRAINPVTKTNWEGKGVQPDVNVPAAQALEKAYALAMEHVLKSTADENLQRLLRMDYEHGKAEARDLARN